MVGRAIAASTRSSLTPRALICRVIAMRCAWNLSTEVLGATASWRQPPTTAPSSKQHTAQPQQPRSAHKTDFQLRLYSMVNHLPAAMPLLPRRGRQVLPLAACRLRRREPVCYNPH